MPQLILSRKLDEKIVIDGCITVTVVEIRGHTVRLGIEAPKEIPILREDAVVKERKPEPKTIFGLWPGK